MKRMIIAVTALSVIMGSVPVGAAEKEPVKLERATYTSFRPTSEIKSLQKNMGIQADAVSQLKKEKSSISKTISALEKKKPFVENRLMDNSLANETQNMLLEPCSFSYRRVDANFAKKAIKAKKMSQRIKTLAVKKANLVQSIDLENQVLSQMRKDMKELQSSDEVVFNPNDVTEKSNISVNQMKRVLSGTELEDFASAYVGIEKDFGINAIAICALSALESGWGTSKRAREDNNYTGFGVYSDEAEGINADSGEENLRMTAAHLQKKYLTEGAVYNNGKSLVDINKKYCVGDTWAYKIADIGYRLMKKLQEDNVSVQ